MSNVHVSKLSGKLKKFVAINSNTLSNPFCIKMHKANKKNVICTKCYSYNMLETFRQNTVPALERNSKLLSTTILTEDELPTIKKPVCRISAHGEIVNYIYLKNIINIINHNPNCVFGFWSKQKGLIKRYFDNHPKPSNVIMVYSNPIIDKVLYTPQIYFDRVFNNVSPDQYTEEQNCTGQKCKDCMICYTLDHPTTTIIEAVK